MAKSKRLGETLVELGVISNKEVEKGLDHAKVKRIRLGEALIELKLCNESQVYKALAMQHNLEYVDVTRGDVPPNATQLIGEDLIRKYIILPLGLEGGGRVLRVAVHDPLDLEMQDVLRMRLGKNIKPILTPRSHIKAVIDEMFNLTSKMTIDQTVDKNLSSMDKTLDRSLDKSLDSSIRSIDKSIDMDKMGGDGDDAAQAPIIKLVQGMIAEAVRSRASDIHIEPMKDRVQVRYRIDGECVVRDRIPIKMKGAMISRIKIMAGIDIAEKRLPQDGRIKLQVDKAQIDFRVSTLPSVHGESCVLRILRPDSVRIGISNLGFEEEDNKAFQKIIKRPNGIFLVTGPTGSGKTTTLYGALNELNRPDRKIITAEDPVEYNFTGINQCQVRDSIGLTFSKVLRAMLRQAPNIILVGEIRDLEVAEVAIQAALTGHLVFSTLHTNDAPGAITRLIDMGVKPFLVASALQAVMAQRLVRVLCPKCKQPDSEPDEMWLKLIGIKPEDRKDKTLYKPRGCENCNSIGFRGRLGVFEMMSMNSEIRNLAFERAATNKIRKAALASGMKSLLQDGRLKVMNGTTTAEEIVKVAQVEGIVT
ncbi:GspE/PulE family protein [Humisphaera borealis]|uniref:Flp pilus assembly complex ATPase component TadA n=1 Tax=Humisphaera borealis TaxID=2807512 RepID=A0A7M2X611_9BACT|nr:ATPase, T2SS/T4P/T4SS family [Humisphaera borealis]QOV92260.1 Flp pilus assembly complex ATPase component TadA [Humisphaera borealis]